MDQHNAICQLSADATIVIPKNCSLEVLAAQLQPFTDKFLYVIDDVALNYYSSLDEVQPGSRRLEPAAPLGYGQTNYYIRDLAQKHLICCFDQNLCHRLLGSTISTAPESMAPLKKSESNPDLTTRTIRIVTHHRPDNVSSEPKAGQRPRGLESEGHSNKLNRSKDSSPNKVVPKKASRSEKDNQRGKVIDLSTPVEVAPSVKVTRHI